MEILNKNHELPLDRAFWSGDQPDTDFRGYQIYSLSPTPVFTILSSPPLPQCSQIQYLEYCLDHAYIYLCINIHYRIHVTVKAHEHFCKKGGGATCWKLWWEFCLSYLNKLLPLTCTSKCIHIYCYLRQVSVGPSHIILELVEITTSNHNYI